MIFLIICVIIVILIFVWFASKIGHEPKYKKLPGDDPIDPKEFPNEFK